MKNPGILINLLLSAVSTNAAASAVSDTESCAIMPPVFEGAKWIGAPGDELPLYSDYLSVFKIDFDVSVKEGGEAALIYGLDDPRLLNPNLNIYNISSKPGESYIKIKISDKGRLSLCRSGYHPDDSPETPVAVLDAGECWKQGENHVRLTSNNGITTVFVNDINIGQAGMNPVGNGGDYISFPVLADMGVEIAGNATVGKISVGHLREPGNTIFSEQGPVSTTKKIEVPQRNMPALKSSVVIKEGKEIKNARINITARGIYDLAINGHRVTNDYFYPGSTQYNKTHLYHTFDIRPYLTRGENTVEVQLGEGWWSGPSTYMGEYWNFFGDRQSLMASIEVEYTDGTSCRTVTSPESWQYTLDTPIMAGSFFHGEVYDASSRRGNGSYHPAVEVGTDESAYPFDRSWSKVTLRENYGDRVVATETLTAISMTQPRKGVYVYDFGQNFAGVPHLTFKSLKPGQEVGVRYAEVLYPDMERYSANAGMIMTENIRAAMNSDRYISAGDPTETFSPRFTLHGFRYLELTGLSDPLPLQDVKAIPLSSVKNFNAEFECSDSLVNRLWENIKWSTRSNFISIPTDCPQRNERLGWMGDISVYAPTATKIADLRPLLRQYLQSVRDCQAADGKFPDVAPTGVGFGGLLWGSAGITVPYQMLLQYGDTAAIRNHYPAMLRYIDYIFDKCIDKNSNVIVQNHAWGDLGDWLSPEYDKNDKSLLWECYLIYDLDIMSRMADAIGETADAEKFASLAAERRIFFKDNYIDPSTFKTRFSSFEPGKEGDTVDTQVSYALPIAMGIVAEDRFVRNFLNTVTRENISDDGKTCPPYSLMTGFIGTAWIQKALTMTGHSDIAYRLLTNKEYPSWLYPVTQGATTVWERLDSYTHTDGFGSNNSMNSFNHYSFGSAGDWLLSTCLGINHDGNGIVISPQPDTTGHLTFASGSMVTRWGNVSSRWEILDDGNVKYEIEVPESATFIAPSGEKTTLKEGYNSIEFPLQ